MKFLFLSSLSFFFLSSFIHGQDPMSEAASIRLSSESIAKKKIVGLPTEVGYDQFSLRTPLFYKAANDWTFAAGLRCQLTDFEISDHTLLNEDRLYSFDLAVFLGKKHSESLDWLFLFNPALAGDFENFKRGI